LLIRREDRRTLAPEVEISGGALEHGHQARGHPADEATRGWAAEPALDAGEEEHGDRHREQRPAGTHQPAHRT
jgi:hypothetical protein